MISSGAQCHRWLRSKNAKGTYRADCGVRNESEVLCRDNMRSTIAHVL